MVVGILAVTVSTAERIATRGVPRPTCVNRSMAFCTMSRLASKSGKMLIAASVINSVSEWVGTSMTNTWLIRRAVRNPVLLEATSRMSSSVCRLPFINSSPLDSCTSATALAAAASLCGASTISKRSMSIPCSRATVEIFAAGPTRMGTMMPASAASTGPRREVSSQGCATMVVAGGTSFALAISRSYFECGGLRNGLLAAIAPIWLSLSMKKPPATALDRAPKMRLSRCFRQKRDIRPRRRTHLDAEQPCDLVQPPLVLGGEVAACTQYEVDEAEHLAPGLGIAREHPRDGGERGLLVEQQHVELLAHECLEDRQRDLAVCAAKAAHRLEAAFVDRAASQSGIDKPADDRFAYAPDGYARLELGDPLLQQFAMNRTPRRLSQRARPHRVDADGSLQGRLAVHRQERPLGDRLGRLTPGIERRDDLARHVLLQRDEGIAGGRGRSVFANLVCQGGDGRHHRVGAGEQLELQPQGMQLLHPFRHRRGDERANDRLRVCAVEREVDLGNPGGGREPPLVGRIVAAERADVIQGPRLAAHQPISRCQVRVGGVP